jgi:hypothetical protein
VQLDEVGQQPGRHLVPHRKHHLSCRHFALVGVEHESRTGWTKVANRGVREEGGAARDGA